MLQGCATETHKCMCVMWSGGTLVDPGMQLDGARRLAAAGGDIGETTNTPLNVMQESSLYKQGQDY